MVSVYTSLFYIEQCTPVVIIQPMFALAKVRLGEGLPWQRSASTKVCLSEGPPRQRSASANVCLGKGLPRQRSALTNVHLGKGLPRQRSTSARVRHGKGPPYGFLTSCFGRKRSVFLDPDLTFKLVQRPQDLVQTLHRLRQPSRNWKSYTVPLKNSTQSHLYKTGHLINHLCPVIFDKNSGLY